MKITVQVTLVPDAGQAAALSATLHRANDLADRVSGVAFARGVPREYELRRHTYTADARPNSAPNCRRRPRSRPSGGPRPARAKKRGM